MKSKKSTARIAARTTAYGLLAEGIPADDIADQFITNALSLWVASTGRQTEAEIILAAWIIRPHRTPTSAAFQFWKSNGPSFLSALV